MSMKEWARSLTSGAVGVIITVGATWYFVNKQLIHSQEIAMVSLTRDLTEEFYSENSFYGDIEEAIYLCKNLYYGEDPFLATEDLRKLNMYLGMFDDLGFYEKEEVIDIKFINQVFGAVIIEAFVHPEIRRYIQDYREHNRDAEAFKHFESLAEKLMALKRFDNIRKNCERNGDV